MEMKNAAEPSKERPFPCRAEEVMAILDGRKTQTRRVAKCIPSWDHLGRDIMDWDLSDVYQEDDGQWILEIQTDVDASSRRKIKCPYGSVGDRLWVRETWFQGKTITKRDQFSETTYPAPIRYRADGEILGYGQDWKPSIHMPRWASRITLEITKVRVERLNEISETDALAEGVAGMWRGDSETTPRETFQGLLDSINAKRGFGWDKNPWVWVLEFRRIK